MTEHIVVIGGGITGLSAVEHLTRTDSRLRVTLLEASDRLGGNIRTDSTDGFVIEHGPDVLLAAKPAALELAARVGLGDRVLPSARGAYVLGERGLVPLLEGITGLIPSRVWPFLTTTLLSPLGKLRVALEFFVPPRKADADESIEHFVVRRLGREMYDRIAEPLLSGISAGDGRRLSLAAMFPQLRALEREHGGLMRGMLAMRRSRTRHAGRARPEPSSPFVSFPGGLGELTEAIVRTLRSRDPSEARIALRKASAAVRLSRSPSGKGFTIDLAGGETVAADALIVATPAYVAGELLHEVDRDLSMRLGEIEYGSSVTVSVAYPSSAVGRALTGTGYVVPRIRKRPVLACTWSSAKFPGRAPEGYALFRVFLGGAGRGSYVSAEDAELREIVANEMRDVMGIHVPPVLERITRFDRAMTQYHVGHLDRVAAIQAAASRIPFLYLAGAAYGGVGIPDCIRSAERAAASAARDVAERSKSPAAIS